MSANTNDRSTLQRRMTFSNLRAQFSGTNSPFISPQNGQPGPHTQPQPGDQQQQPQLQPPPQDMSSIIRSLQAENIVLRRMLQEQQQQQSTATPQGGGVNNNGQSPTNNTSALENALTVARLKEEITLMQQHVQDADLAVKKAEKKVNAFQVALDKSNADYKELSIVAKQDAEGRIAAENRCNGLSNQLEMMQQTVTALMDKVTHIDTSKQKTQSDLEGIITKTVNVNEAAIRELSDKTEMLNHAQHQLAELHNVVRITSSAKEEAERSLHTLASQVVSLESERDKLTVSLQQANAQVAELTTKRTNLMATNSMIQSELDKKLEVERLYKEEKQQRRKLSLLLEIACMEREEVRSYAACSYVLGCQLHDELVQLRDSHANVTGELITYKDQVKNHEQELEDMQHQFKIKMKRQTNLMKDLQHQLQVAKDKLNDALQQQNHSMPLPSTPKFSDTAVPNSSLPRSDDGSTVSLAEEEQTGLLNRLTEMQETIWALEECKRAGEVEVMRLADEIKRKDTILQEKFHVEAKGLTGGSDNGQQQTNWWAKLTNGGGPSPAETQLHKLLEHATFENLRLQTNQRRMETQCARLQGLLDKARSMGLKFLEDEE